jgi:hypothetical protein
MTPTALAKQLYSNYGEYRLDHVSPALCKHATVMRELGECIASGKGLLTMAAVGSSIASRSISLITAGKGPKKVLLWSQMHGDESTATLALLDIFNFLVKASAKEKWIARMLGEITIHAIPMLNPDGAERVDRRTAVGIDMNRDAMALATPEAQILRQMQKQLKPAFGFNLHDQELSSVGASGAVTALALLAPAADEKKTKTPGRLRAMRVASLLARTLSQFAHDHIACYDDAFEPRAFGDNMQKWGTSTVLIESGQWPGDPDKNFIRKLNFVGILTALRSIGDGSYQDVDLDYYTSLPPNTKRIYDIIIRSVQLHSVTGWEHAVDIGCTFDPTLNKPGERNIVTVKEIGDLSTFGALQTMNGSARTVPADLLPLNATMPLGRLLDILQLPAA